MAKIRNGFVSNSSSSSFVINKKYLSPDNAYKILNMHKELKDNPEKYNLEYTYYVDDWKVYENSDNVSGSTYMNNFDPEDFFRQIGVDLTKVEWEY